MLLNKLSRSIPHTLLSVKRALCYFWINALFSPLLVLPLLTSCSEKQWSLWDRKSINSLHNWLSCEGCTYYLIVLLLFKGIKVTGVRDFFSFSALCVHLYKPHTKKHLTKHLWTFGCVIYKWENSGCLSLYLIYISHISKCALYIGWRLKLKNLEFNL